jgi:hypothetical protein
MTLWHTVPQNFGVSMKFSATTEVVASTTTLITVSAAMTRPRGAGADH